LKLIIKLALKFQTEIFGHQKMSAELRAKMSGNFVKILERDKNDKKIREG